MNSVLICQFKSGKVTCLMIVYHQIEFVYFGSEIGDSPDPTYSIRFLTLLVDLLDSWGIYYPPVVLRFVIIQPFLLVVFGFNIIFSRVVQVNHYTVNEITGCHETTDYTIHRSGRDNIGQRIAS